MKNAKQTQLLIEMSKLPMMYYRDIYKLYNNKIMYIGT